MYFSKGMTPNKLGYELNILKFSLWKLYGYFFPKLQDHITHVTQTLNVEHMENRKKAELEEKIPGWSMVDAGKLSKSPW